jgi:hypothetical protein
MHFATSHRITPNTASDSKIADSVDVVGSKAYMQARGFREMTGREALCSWRGAPRKFWIARTAYAFKRILSGHL